MALDEPRAAATDEAVAACRLTGVALSRGGRRVLDGLDLTVGAAERVALIGPNGAGKTSLLNAVVGLAPITAGRVEALGRDLAAGGARAAVRGETGYVFQRHALVKRRTVLSNVLHGLLHRPGAWRAWSAMLAPEAWRAEAMEALAEVGLADRAADRADRLSGGQAQRVAIARALVRRPRLVIADEPTASLDPAAGREVMSLFSRIVAKRGVALLFTTHDMADALAYADRVVALKGGRIVLDRRPAEVKPGELEAVFDG